MDVVKKFWWVGALVVALVIGALALKKHDDSFVTQLQQLQVAHDVELKQIEVARIEEQKAHDADVKKLQDDLKSVQDTYDASQKQITDKKAVTIKSIVKQFGDNPIELANQLSKATGIPVYVL